MKQSDPLQLVAPGTLARPGPLGRLVRLLVGIACSYALFHLYVARAALMTTPLSALPDFTLMALVGLYVENHVVNIGFGRSWGRLPRYVTLTTLLFLAALSWLLLGSANSAGLGVALWLWLVYVYLHLGVSFLLAAAIGTPGCEMRALPDLYGRLTGRTVPEHHCPAAFISSVDEWEISRSKS